MQIRLPQLLCTTRSVQACLSGEHPPPHSPYCRDCGAPLPPDGQG